jgi:predicted N-acetyltransferase YhbS
MGLLFRRLTDEDYAGILALQEANLFDNLSTEARQDGFLSARFSREQFVRMDRDVGVLVARDAERVVGYLCASGVELNQQFPLLLAMIARYGEVTFRGRALADQKTFVYGPVCVHRAHRGRGVLRGLFRALLREIPGRFDAGVAFVAEDNQRSLAAHIAGLGMDDVGDFEFKGKRYRILAFGGGATHAG